ncbi:MAG: co-chaperone GroES [Bacteroidota bacterium]
MSIKINPLRDNVLVKPDAPEQTLAAGIVIPDNAKEKPQKGQVIAVGPGTKEEQMVLKPGDQIMYSKYSGTEVEIKGEEHLIMRQSDIYATLK